MIIHFPEMHPALSTGRPEGVLCLEPGLAKTVPAGAWKPEGLPYDPRTAAACLRDFMQYGEQFRNIRDLSRIGAGGLDDFYTGTSMSIRSELMDLEAGRTNDADALLARARQRAQLALLLGWSMEERVIEMQTLNDGVRAAWERFGKSLGIGEEELGEEEGELLELAAVAPGAPVVDLADYTLAWRPVLEAMLVLLPEDAVLLTTRAEIRDDLEEYGVPLTTPAPELLQRIGLVRGSLLAATAPGYRLLTRKRPPADADWLLAERTVLLPGEGRR